ncbi:hypothetical protein [Vibrio penaeicida]|uniref:hypothetical protein n=1 Tax=Vibrio penaeicida TaxID=104609 RepID=UPI000CEA1724|nr:hypothetical protein [Vibrio penaeicida]
MERPSRRLELDVMNPQKDGTSVVNKNGRKPRILFLCDGKNAWSGLAASILHEKAGSFFDVHAALCCEPKHSTKAILNKLDMESLTRIETRKLEQCNHLDYEYLIALSPSALVNTKALPKHRKFIPWNIEDEAYPENQINEQLNYLLSLYLYQ